MYVKNYVCGHVVFQFLIGRLKTQKQSLERRFSQQFQFLIGRLKTQVKIALQHFQQQFQFLIGRLKTISSASKTGSNA